MVSFVTWLEKLESKGNAGVVLNGVRLRMERGRRPRSRVGSFFFQAEDGIRDLTVTGVQTCALPICLPRPGADRRGHRLDAHHGVVRRPRPAHALPHRGAESRGGVRHGVRSSGGSRDKKGGGPGGERGKNSGWAVSLKKKKLDIVGSG